MRNILVKVLVGKREREADVKLVRTRYRLENIKMAQNYIYSVMLGTEPPFPTTNFPGSQ